MLKNVPLWAVLALYFVASTGCFVLYAVDQSAAKAHRWRVPERTLLLLCVAGGWPGAFFAQHVLNHKSRKVSFRLALWSCAVVNVMAFAFLRAA